MSPDHRRPDPRKGHGLATLSVFNAALNYRLDWRGEFRTLEEANEATIVDADLMGADWGVALANLRADAALDRRMRTCFGASWGKAAVLASLAEFQRTLVATGSRFDRYLAGERGAITTGEERGLRLFEGLGCASCHQGRNVGGNLLQKFGVFADPHDGRAETARDLGRFALTRREGDRYLFRVPSLRNVAVRGPYLHDGSAATLEEAIEVMGRVQLGRELPRADVVAIASFLRTLTGSYRGKPLDRMADEAGR